MMRPLTRAQVPGQEYHQQYSQSGSNDITAKQKCDIFSNPSYRSHAKLPSDTLLETNFSGLGLGTVGSGIRNSL
jgi:hypothetical protein